jgi:7-keto-8-aminopelargonate synthetase-like enzyme
MAKIKHNNFLDSVVSVLSEAKDAGVLHLYAEGSSFNGRHINISGKELYHFGTTGYLGLEQDQRLKEGAIQAIANYGTQFPLSKSYISHHLYEELEFLISEIYGHHIIITKNSTLGHMAVIPSIIEDGDGVILDHQVHWSVQNAVNPLKLRSVSVEMIRHSNLEMLEDKIKKLQSKCSKIWYMADGVYSMYGDYAPVEDLMRLSEKYPQLHLYFDDVHGMSWKGYNGNGYVMSILKELPHNVILFGTLSKTFGASGAVMVTSNKKFYERVRNFGGPLSFSAQLEPASVGAAIASAKIHLSSEIFTLQDKLERKIQYFNKRLLDTDLPLIAHNDSPVFFIGAGSPKTGYNLVNRLFKNGIYVNLGIFPAVPIKNTGLRITLSLHNRKEDIDLLVDQLEKNYPKALDDTHTWMAQVQFAFGIETAKKKSLNSPSNNLICKLEKSITDIEKNLWNQTVGQNGLMDYRGMLFLESAFTNNEFPEENFDFYYLVITDHDQKPVLITFFTYGLWKEDMLSPQSVSLEIERRRKKDTYLHTSYCLSMGSFMTSGTHLFLDRKHSHWKPAIGFLLNEIEQLQHELKPQSTILRDFDPLDEELARLFHKNGFFMVKMPEGTTYENFSWNTFTGYFNSLSKRSRRHFKNEISPNLDKVAKEWIPFLEDDQLERCYQLYLKVKQNNPGLNTFDYPKKLFLKMNNSHNWIFLLLKVNKKIVGVMFCYYNNNYDIFVPSLVGLDYTFNEELQLYRQLLYHSIIEAKTLGATKIDFGLTAGFEKRKLGAEIHQNCAYIQTQDNFTFEALDWLRKD